MSDPVTNAEIEDVLSSIRRLVSDEPGRIHAKQPQPEPASAEKLVLTPALRVTETAERPAPKPVPEPELHESRSGHAAEAYAFPLDEATPAAAEADGGYDLTLEQRIAELEAAINQTAGEWEPDGSEEVVSDLTQPLRAEPVQAAEMGLAEATDIIPSDGDEGEGDPLAGVALKEEAAAEDDWDAPEEEIEDTAEVEDESEAFFAADESEDEDEFEEAEPEALEVVLEEAEPAVSVADLEEAEPEVSVAVLEEAEFEVSEDDHEEAELEVPEDDLEEAEPDVLEMAAQLAAEVEWDDDVAETAADAPETVETAVEKGLDAAPDDEPVETAAADLSALFKLVEPGAEPGAAAGTAPDDVAAGDEAPGLDSAGQSEADEQIAEAEIGEDVDGRGADEALTDGIDDATQPAVASSDADDEVFSLYGEDTVLDEEALRQIVADLVREELQGVLGERITRNVRRLVRREIQRSLALREFE